MIEIQDYSQFEKFVIKKKDKKFLDTISSKLQNLIPEGRQKLVIERALLMETEEKPIVLLVSDIHLGAFGNISKVFESFIDQIINNDFNDIGTNLKAFIILGDFFDVIMQGRENLIRNHTSLYEKLYNLHQKGVCVLFILGNHEIPVDGPYDKNFFKRKSELVENFKKYLKDNEKMFELFSPNNFCQYIILRKRFSQENNQLYWELALFDSKENIKQNMDESRPFISKILCEAKSEENKEFKCLMAHGFQFESAERLKIAAEVWKACMGTLDIVKNIVVNFFWNIIFHTLRNFIYTGYLTFEFIIKKLKRLGKKRKLIKEYQKEKTIKQKLKKRWITEYLENLKEMKKIRYTIDNDKYNQEIEHFLSNDEFSNIKDIIYGHTHHPQVVEQITQTQMIEQEEIMEQAQIYERQESLGKKVKRIFIPDEKFPKGLIVNTGTWQIAMEKDRNPNIVGIYPSGNIKVYEGILNKEKNKIIELKSF